MMGAWGTQRGLLTKTGPGDREGDWSTMGPRDPNEHGATRGPVPVKT